MKQGKLFLSGVGKKSALFLTVFVMKLAIATPSAAQDEGQKKIAIATGERLTVTGKGISIVPPKGWEVHQDNPHLSLVLQIPFSKDLKYQRTIQVMTFTGQKYIDSVTAKEFEELIVRKFTAASAGVENYRIRNNMPIELTDGRSALLFYSEFLLDGVSLMQAHILTSTRERHYLTTFTDLAEHFEDEMSGVFLTEAWNCMTSVELNGRTPLRFENIYMFGAGVFVIFLVVTILLTISKMAANRRYSRYSEEEFADDDPTTLQAVSRQVTGSGHDSLSEADLNTRQEDENPSFADDDVSESEFGADLGPDDDDKLSSA
jgi:hypothetical protein